MLVALEERPHPTLMKDTGALEVKSDEDDIHALLRQDMS